MTDEQRWLTAENTYVMFRLVRSHTGSRKWRLFACACCRRIESALSTSSLKVLEVTEQFQERQIRDSDREVAHQTLYPPSSPTQRAVFYASSRTTSIVSHARRASRYAAETRRSAGQQAVLGERRAQCALLREVFGNPFQKVCFDPAWLHANDGIVAKVAAGIYLDKAFDQMPILADALEEAGCTNEAILGHCRGSGPHVRGCWVLDALLGKK